jgi:hypothetical protein
MPIMPLVLLLLFAGLCAAAPASALPPAPLYTLDLSATNSLALDQPAQVRATWDTVHFAASLQGIVNRRTPSLYVHLVGGKTGETDRFWLGEMRKPGTWLAGRNVKPLRDVAEAAQTFRAAIRGVVAYDERVPATSNVASTIAGVEDLVCLRYDPDPASLYSRLVTDPKGPRLPVKRRLMAPDGSPLFTGRGTIPGSATPSTGSAKCDAYIWAKERYLDTGKCDATRLAYYLDAWWIGHPGGDVPNHTLSNHDYFIARRGFFFDLSMWDDEAPVDDLTQPVGADARTLMAILRTSWACTGGKKMIHVGGFVPWAWKYTNYGQAGGKREGVPAEWRYAEILSCYNAFMDADALGYSAMANASVFSLQPLKPAYKQPRPTLADLKSRGLVLADGLVAPRTFVTIYGGDYDAAAWLYQRLPAIWADPARGTIPVGWAFNPNLADRFAMGMDWARTHAKPGDAFIAGDSGAGYVNPSYLSEPRPWSGLPSGLATWVEHCTRYYRQWDLSITGFVIDGNAPGMGSAGLDAYARFSPDGIIGQKTAHASMHGAMPVVRMAWDLYSAEAGAEVIASRCKPNKPEFAAYRTILWSPTDLKRLMDNTVAQPRGAKVAFVDPYTLMALVKQFNVGPDNGKARLVPMAQPTPETVTNRWDVRLGAEATGHSPLVAGCDARDALGGSYGAMETGDLILFADKAPVGSVHFLEWRTKTPMQLQRYRLSGHGDGGSLYREFGEFRLYARKGGEWTQIDTYAPEHPYASLRPGAHLLLDRTLPQAVTAQEFRAEFTQWAPKDGVSLGPRIVELEGLGPTAP